MSTFKISRPSRPQDHAFRPSVMGCPNGEQVRAVRSKDDPSRMVAVVELETTVSFCLGRGWVLESESQRQDTSSTSQEAVSTPSPETNEPQTQVDALLSQIASLTVANLKIELEKGYLDEHLDAVLLQEMQRSRTRVSAVDAINDRIKEVEEASP